MKFSTSSFVAGFMLGALFVGAWFVGGNPSFMQFPSSYPAAITTIPTPEKSGAVSVVDQPSGDSVIVESITVPPPGVWVAIREVVGDELGNVLGAARIDGPRSAVSISLLRATEPNRSYAVELYRDDNAEAFDPSINSVYVDFDTGARVVVYFLTTD